MSDQPEPRTHPNGVPYISPQQRLLNLEDIAKLHDLIGTINLYIGHYVESQLTTEQKELLYDVVESRHPDIYADRDENERWWRQ